MFQTLPELRADALVRVGQLFRADDRAEKLDLGVGVYRDAEGFTPVLEVVKDAEQVLKDGQVTKSYLSPNGDPEFLALMTELVLGKAAPNLIVAQTPGGTGAFHQGLALVKATGSNPTVWVGTPTWPNHIPMIAHQKIPHATYAYYDIDRQKLCFDQLIDALRLAKPGDLFLLHGCCHNPTGADLSSEQWDTIGTLMVNRGVVPLIDFAYQGFGRGGEEDAAGVRNLIQTVPEAIVAVSCSKSFSLYQERTGIIIIKCNTNEKAAKIWGTMQMLARLNYSNPPGHGSAVVKTILSTPEMRHRWLDELTAMRMRVIDIRNQLADEGARVGADLSFIAENTGLFATFPLSVGQCERMGSEFAIHMPDTGRINIAGLATENVARFVSALRSVQNPPTNDK